MGPAPAATPYRQCSLNSPRLLPRRPLVTAAALGCSATTRATGCGRAAGAHARGARPYLTHTSLVCGGRPLLGHPVLTRPAEQRRCRTRVIAEVASDLVPLGFDFLTFLAATVLVIPLFKHFKLSPVLGFLFSGVLLKQLGLFHDINDMERLAEYGVLFLLFEMGLELSLDRLKALAKYAFILGTLQVALCTGIFTAFALPVGHGFGTVFLEQVAHAPHRLVSIRSVDEAIVIGAALSMSSSAFVLQLLQERGELASKYGSATLGVLLFQDIAVIPFLVLLPLVTSHQGSADASIHLLESASSPVSLLTMLGPTALQTVAGLGGLLIADRLILKRIFEMVVASRNKEAFIALCLLTVAGTSLLTQRLGLSDSMGAFLAGVLLAETSYRTQVEADIRPVKGLLLGLFFVTTGATINMTTLQAHWQEVLWMLAGLLVIKTSVVAACGKLVGLSRNESIRTGFLLSQGGEFAFVLLSLANQLRILPSNLNQLLIIVVVMSMALTPSLAEAGKVVADKLDEWLPPPNKALPAGQDAQMAADLHKLVDPVVICGFGPAGQMVANTLECPLAASGGPPITYVAFDQDPARVKSSQQAGFKVLFGDATRTSVLRAAGIDTPKAVAVCFSDREMALDAVRCMRADFSLTPIYACAADLRHAVELEEAGADEVVVRSVEAGVTLGGQILTGLGANDADVSYITRGIQDSIRARTQAVKQLLASEKGSGASALAALELIVLSDSERSQPLPSASNGDGGDATASSAAAAAAAETDVTVSVVAASTSNGVNATGANGSAAGLNGHSANGSAAGAGAGAASNGEVVVAVAEPVSVLNSRDG